MKRNIKKTVLFSIWFTLLLAGSLTPQIFGAGQQELIAFTSERDGNGNIYLMKTDGSNLQRLTDDPGYDAWPTWSPDGSRIAFVSTRSGNPDIYVMDIDGTDIQQLTDNSANDLWPEWSPDGTRIVFTSNREGNFDIYVMDANGGNLQRLTSLSSSEDFPAWSPDGSRIVFSRIGGSDGTYIMNADGSDEQKILDFPALESDWSPDGTKLAFGSDHEGFRAIYVANTDGSGLLRLSTTYAGDNCPDWTSDGTKILFASWRNGNGEIYVMNADGSSQQRLTVNSAQDEFPSWRPATTFVRITEGPQVSDGGWSFGVSWVDYDGDNYPDLFVNNNIFESVGELNFLYHNNGDGTYEKVLIGPIATEGGSVGSTWADFDSDGDNDVYVSCFNQYNYFYNNQGDGTFIKETTVPLGTLADGTMEAEWVDYNNDGRLDLSVVNHRPPGDPNPIKCALYLNEGGYFTQQDNIAIGLLEDEGNSTAWGDYDNDGDRDLFWSRNDKLTLFFDNDGDGTFTQNTGISIAQSPRKYHGNWADYDNDGDLDLYTGAGYPDPPYLLENNGEGDFIPVTGQPLALDTGYWIGGYWGDYDNDGWLDLLILGHYYYGPYPNHLYRNNGDGTFTRVTSEPVATDEEPSSAAAWADHDRDGDLDLFVANVNNYNNTLYENQGNANHWLQIRLEGKLSNRSGIGAKIRLRAILSGTPVWQMREISAKNGFMSQGELIAHFGLGDATFVDSVMVEWPSGIVDTLTGVAVDQLLIIKEGDYNDLDGDDIRGFEDNCPDIYNPGQEDNNGDGIGNDCCCADMAGNVDCSESEEPDISDITRLIDYLYISHEELCCPYEADANGSSDQEPDISDITKIIDYLYLSHTSLSPCPVAFLDIPHGMSVTIDGTIETGEWDDAAVVSLAVEGEVEAIVRVKHDGTNILAAYTYDFPGEENLCFPEILLDTENDKSEDWQSDD
jgi:Tol biopolymer transport system component